MHLAHLGAELLPFDRCHALSHLAGGAEHVPVEPLDRPRVLTQEQRGQVAHRALEFLHAHHSSIQLELIILIDAHDRVFEFRRRIRRGLGFRQIDLHFRLVFFECSRDHEKDEEDGEDIDQRNDNDRGRPPLPNSEIHLIPTSLLTLVFAPSSAPAPILPARPVRNNISRSAPPPAFPFPPT